MAELLTLRDFTAEYLESILANDNIFPTGRKLRELQSASTRSLRLTAAISLATIGIEISPNQVKFTENSSYRWLIDLPTESNGANPNWCDLRNALLDQIRIPRPHDWHVRAKILVIAALTPSQHRIDTFTEWPYMYPVRVSFNMRWFATIGNFPLDASVRELNPQTNDDSHQDLRESTAFSAFVEGSSAEHPIIIDENHDLPAFIVQLEKSGMDCVLCLQENIEIENLVQLPNCMHLCCYTCISAFFKLALSDEAACPPKCCKSEIPISVAEAFKALTPVELLLYTARREEVMTEDRKYCYYEKCSAFISPQQISRRKASCKCSKKTCIKCNKKYHTGQCKTVSEEALHSLKRIEGWQSCPHCHEWVSKNEGCDHITCKCKGEFCYLCGSKWLGDVHCVNRDCTEPWEWNHTEH